MLKGQTSAVIASRDCGRVIRRVIKAPQMSVVEVPEPLDEQTGLIKVILNGDIALMFAEDIRARGKRCSDGELKGAKAVSA